MSSHHPEAHGGPVPKPKQLSVPRRAEEEESVGPSRKPLVILGLLFMFICLGIIFAAIYYSAQSTVITEDLYYLEFKQVSDVQCALEAVVNDPRKRAALQNPNIRDARGQRLYEVLLKKELLDGDIDRRLVSLQSTTERRSDRDWIHEQYGRMPENACSYTAPRVGDLAELMERKGTERVVLITFNSRNWNNYPDKGVIVLWSDGETPGYMTFEDAHEDWGITRAEWDDPAGKLFGQKHPFEYTYE